MDPEDKVGLSASGLQTASHTDSRNVLDRNLRLSLSWNRILEAQWKRDLRAACSSQLRTTRVDRGFSLPEDTFPIPRENAKIENSRGGKVGSSSTIKSRRG